MKRFLIIVGTTAILLVTGPLFRRAGYLQAVSGSQPISDVRVPSPLARSSVSNSRPVERDEKAVSDRDTPAKIRAMIEAGNVPISFWGKVTDQDGEPLPGVRIVYAYSIHHGNDLGSAWIDLEERKGEAISDREGGLFAIAEIKGHDLTLESLSKPGYIFRKRFSRTYDFGGNVPEWRFRPQQDNPVLITMIQASIPEMLIHLTGGLQLSGDGVPGRWNLWNGEPDDDGELSVSLKRDPQVLNWPNSVSTWTADLQVVGGGISEAPWEEDVHRAPESGYTPAVAYSKEPPIEGVRGRSFYLRTRNGNYGRIQVQLYPSDEGPTARCFITSDMNPRPGSHNLEPTEGD